MACSARGGVTALLYPLLCSLLSMLLLAPSAMANGSRKDSDPKPPTVNEDFAVAKVLSVTSPEINQDLLNRTGMVSKRQFVELEVTEGPLKEKVFKVPNEITDNPAFNVSPKPGQEVVVCVVTEKGTKPEVNIADYHRAPVLLWLFIAFLAVFLLFGGKQGVKSLAGLVVTVALIAFVMLPLSLNGVSPLFTSVVICLAAITTSIVFVAGMTKKSAAAICGTIGGVIVSGVSSHIVISLSPLTGLSSEEAQILRGSVLHQPPEFFSGLLAAAMLIGALGVIMDVGISIASSVSEVAKTDTTLSMKRLYESGMNVGRDIMGTMTNTLILAYTGSALPLLLLTSQIPSAKLVNLDLVATEVASALTGSLGLVCTIPLTAIAAARLMANTSSQKGEQPDMKTASS